MALIVGLLSGDGLITLTIIEFVGDEEIGDNGSLSELNKDDGISCGDDGFKSES